MTPISIETIAQYASAIGLGLTAILFYITYHRQRESDQMKMAHDIQQGLTNAENTTLAEIQRPDFTEEQKRYRNIQYLNVWEWFSFQVNHGEIKNENIHEFFRPTLIRDRESILALYPDLEQHSDSFKELKELYQKWKRRN